MLVEFFKAAEQDRPGTCYTKGLDRKFYPTEDVLLVIEHEDKIRILDFHGSRADRAGYARTLYGNFPWPIDFPLIDIGQKTPMNVLDTHIYFNQSGRNNAIKMINQKYGNRMFGAEGIPSLPLDQCPIKEVEMNHDLVKEVLERFKDEDSDFNPKYSNDHEIGIVLGGYLDSNSRLIDRKELNRRIKAKDKEIEELKAIVLNMNDEGAKQSARDVWFTKFHDIVKQEDLSPARYVEINGFMFSENDR